MTEDRDNRAGRVHIQKDLTVAGRRNVCVVGDTSLADQDGGPLSGVAQVTMQQGDYAGRLITDGLPEKPTCGPSVNKGNIAVVADSFRAAKW
jgi:NADH dehydrogenase